MGPVCCEEIPSSFGDGDVGASTLFVMVVEETTLIGLLPDWQARTRRAPCLDHFGVRPRAGTNPLQQVEDQGIDGVGHDRLLSRQTAPVQIYRPRVHRSSVFGKDPGPNP